MKKMDNPRSKEACLKHFYRVMVDCDWMNQMRLPLEINKFFNGRVRMKIIMKTYDGYSSEISVVEREGVLTLKKGWLEVVKKLGLVHTDYIFFQYTGGYEFLIRKVFDGRSFVRKDTVYDDINVYEFIQPYVADECFNYVTLPSDSIKFLNGPFPWKGTLVDCDGKKWDIMLHMVDNVMILKDGWSLFVEDKRLKVGDLIVFQYRGGRKFVVREIYTKSCCRRYFAQRLSLNPVVVSNDDETEEGSSREGRGVSHDNVNSEVEIDSVTGDQSNINTAGGSQRPRRKSTRLGNSSVKFDGNETCWKKVVSSSLASGKQAMHLPFAFVRKKMNMKMEVIEIVMESGSSISCDLRWYDSTKDFCYITKGWYEFVRVSDLQVGDKLRFVHRDTHPGKIFMFVERKE